MLDSASRALESTTGIAGGAGAPCTDHADGRDDSTGIAGRFQRLFGRRQLFPNITGEARLGPRTAAVAASAVYNKSHALFPHAPGEETCYDMPGEWTMTRPGLVRDGGGPLILQAFTRRIWPDASHWRYLTTAPRSRTWAVTVIWLPPAYKGHEGISDVGYGVATTSCDLGEFSQKGSRALSTGRKDSTWPPSALHGGHRRAPTSSSTTA